MAKHISKRKDKSSTPEYRDRYDLVEWVNYDFKVGEIDITTGKDRYYGFVEWKQDGDDWVMICPECGWEMTKVEDAIFCHPGLFICGAKSKEGAIALAKLAINTME